MPIKRLPPTLRIRERYIVFQIMSDKGFRLDETVRCIWNSLLELYGEVGVSSFHIWIPSNLYNSDRGIGIIRCSHDAVQQVRASLALIKKMDGNKVTIRTLGVTGTIRSAKSRYMQEPKITDF